MNNQQKINAWILEELAIRRSEGTPLHSEMIEQSFEPTMFVNVLANHIEEFSTDKVLLKVLYQTFAQRGLTGKRWFATLLALNMDASEEQRPMIDSLMEFSGAKRQPGFQILWLNDLPKK